MPRIRRVTCPGVPHHVTQRGNRRAQVFFANPDREEYLRLLRLYSSRHAVEILAYCLMTNHVHLVAVPTTPDGLHRMLRPLHMRYAQRINVIRNWKGHLWQGRYFSSMLDDGYLWAAIRYVELNPVRARMVERAEDYPWSSAAAHCRLLEDSILTQDPAWRSRLKRRDDWSAWLAAGESKDCLDTLRRHADKGLPCGSPEFIDRLERATGRVLRERPQGRPRRNHEMNHEMGTQPFL